MNLILVRHGETAWNVSGKYQGQTDVPLSAAGLKQAQILAAYFPVAKVDAIYASDLKRAMVTAEYLGKKFGLTVRPEKAFRELNFGDWEGLTYEEITAKWPEAMDNFLAHPDKLVIPNGESFAMLQDRAMAKVREMIALHPEQNVVLVAHGAVLRTVLAAALDIPLANVWRLRQYNTAISLIRYTDTMPLVEVMNSTAHLIYGE